MSLETRITSLAKAIGKKIKIILITLTSKLDSSGHTPKGYVKTDDEGKIIVEELTLVESPPIDGVEYVMKNGLWIKLVKTSSVEWESGIKNKPSFFPPELHNHDEIYHRKEDLNIILEGKANSVHDHDDRYYTEEEMDTFLEGKESSIEKNTAFNKNFGITAGTVSEGNHNHNSIYFTKTEINTLLNDLTTAGHDHNALYYTKVQIDTMLEGEYLSTTHNHDDRYYTEEEMDVLLENKSDLDHNHNDIYMPIEDLLTLLDGKANSVHDHDDRYYTEEEMDTFLEDKSQRVHYHDDRYYTEEEVNAKLESVKLDLESKINVSNNMTPEGGIMVNLEEGRTFGKYKDGDLIPGNISLLEVIQEAVTEYLPAEFIYPEALIQTNADEFEIGTTLSADITLLYVQNDAGEVKEYRIIKDGQTVLADSSSNTYTEDSLVLTQEETIYTGEIDFNEGTEGKPNTSGVMEPNPIKGGTLITTPLIIKGYMPIFKGSTKRVLKTGEEIRNNLEKELKTENLDFFILDTGSENNIFQFWVPKEYTVTDIVDVHAFNAFIIGDYTRTSISVPDAGGNLMEGNLYTFEMDVPYSSNHSHKILLS